MNIYSITATTYKLIFTIDSTGYEKPICKIDSISNGFATCANQITIKLWSEAPYKAAPFKEIAGLTSFNSILYLKDQNVLLCGGNFNIYVYSMVSY